VDHDVSEATFIGISYGDEGQVWKQDGKFLSRIGTPSSQNLTKSENQSFRDFFKGHIEGHIESYN